MEVIIERLGLYYCEREIRSRIMNRIVFIDSRLSKQEKWQEFAHELKHYL